MRDTSLYGLEFFDEIGNKGDDEIFLFVLSGNEFVDIVETGENGPDSR